MLPDSELERPNDRVVRFHLQKQVGERPIFDLEIKPGMLNMVDSSSVEIHGKACQLRKNWPKLANAALLTEMNVLEIQVMALEKPVMRFGEATAHQIHVLIRILRELMEALWSR